MNLALLVDLDNIKPRLSTIESICEQYGNILERRAFSNTPAVLTCYGSDFHHFSYRLELATGSGSIPQEVDRLIQQTVWELIESPTLKIDIVAVVSNDNDYANLFRQLRSRKIKTVVIGNQIGNQLRDSADYVEFIQELIRPTYVGIDLGTTNTVMAIAKFHELTNQWVTVPIDVNVLNEQSQLVKGSIIPSAVRFSSQTKAEVGGHVKGQAYAFRDQTILAWKHHMGYSTNGKPFHYNLTGGKIYPEQAAAEILRFCRDELVQKSIEVQGAVITHPASYESDAIEATRKAAVLAGWKEEEVVLLSEPQAALYDFLHRLQRGDLPLVSLNIQEPCNLLVYDLGGGTLDVTLHKVQWNQTDKRFIIEDLAIGSRTRVGGDSVDKLTAEFISKNSPGYEELSEPEKRKLEYEILVYAEKFKKVWGGQYEFAQDKNNFSFPFQAIFLEGKFPILYRMTVEKMHEILAPLLCEDINLASVETMDPATAFDEPPFTNKLNSFIVPVLDVFLRTKQSLGYVPQIHAVLLNGGMTYFLPVRERLTKLFGKTSIITEGNPDLAVARGAALYAAGAIKPGSRINPTNIYLEVNENGEDKLRLLVRQGEKYPYKTALKGFKLPNTNKGYLALSIWVGMGTKRNVNTSLQRRRYIDLNEVLESIPPGCSLDLELEYTFDERVLLTLVATEDSEARFPLEVSDIEGSPDPVNIPPEEDIVLSIIPCIPRTRGEIPISPGTRVNFRDWEVLARTLNSNWANGKQHEQRRRLTRKSAGAENRVEIIHKLIQWLEVSHLENSALVNTQVLIAVMALSRIFQLLDMNSSESSQLEEKFKNWIRQKFDSGLLNISYQLFNEIVETPGRLLWSDFDNSLIHVFKSYQTQTTSLAFLNSLAKCGRSTRRNLDLLHHVIKYSQHRGHKEKAAWALGRLISPGQPQEWKADFQDVESAVKLTLDQLYHHTTEPQIAQNLLVCLSQGLAWQIEGQTFSPEICGEVRKLPDTPLPVERRLQSSSQIRDSFEKRLSIILKMLEPEKASPEDRRDIYILLSNSINNS